MIQIYNCNKCNKKYGTEKSAKVCCLGLEIKDPIVYKPGQLEYQKEYNRIKRGYYNNKRRTRAVINTETKEEFTTITLAAKSIGMSKIKLRRMLIGESKNTTKFKLL